MKKIIILLLVILFTTGCSITRIDNLSIDETVSTILSKSSNLENNVSNGYGYYIPKGVAINDTEKNNIILLDENNSKYYMYVDVISYYHKVNSTYDKCTNCYYSSELDYNGKVGYIEINEVKDKYFIEVMFNYSKIEVYIEKINLNETIINILSILNSVKYNDTILNTLVGDNALNYNEETFDIFKPKRTTGAFSNYIEVYGNYNDVDNELPNEDTVTVGEE